MRHSLLVPKVSLFLAKVIYFMNLIFSLQYQPFPRELHGLLEHDVSQRDIILKSSFALSADGVEASRRGYFQGEGALIS